MYRFSWDDKPFCSGTETFMYEIRLIWNTFNRFRCSQTTSKLMNVQKTTILKRRKPSQIAWIRLTKLIRLVESIVSRRYKNSQIHRWKKFQLIWRRQTITINRFDFLFFLYYHYNFIIYIILRCNCAHY